MDNFMMNSLNGYFGDIQAVSLIIAAFVFIVSISYYHMRTKDLLPGPKGLPFLGYWPFLKDETCHLKMDEFRKQYGDLFSINIAGTHHVVMSSVKAARELQVAKADCFERTSDFSVLLHILGDGVGFINGEPWKVLRKFTVNQFRELGMTSLKDNVSGPIHDSLRETINFLQSKKGEPVELVSLLTDKCNAILRHSLVGHNGISEQEVREANDAYGVCISFMTVTNLLLSGNFARYFIFPFKSGYRASTKQLKVMKKILADVIKRHKCSSDEEHPNNYISAFFKERRDRESKGDPTANYFTDKALISSLVQFVGDGVISVAMFLVSFMKYAVDNPEGQDKIYSEVLEVVGRDRLPTIEDKKRMPFTNSVILEIMRFGDFPLFPSQQCIKETTVRGYRIPKGAITVLNMWSCHHDPDVYEDPMEFKPDRFVTEEGKQKPELPLVFGIGKRACIGESFTMAQVFLFLTAIIQHFRLKEKSKTNVMDIFLTGKMEVYVEPRS